MNKDGKLRVLILSAAAFLLALFGVFLFLTLPIGGRASPLPVTALYAVGGVAAIGMFAGAFVLFLRSRKSN